MGSWSMRGNYGPAWVMEEAVGAYTPNVTWSRKGDRNPSRLADRNGGGTSAATPQVAAAAALWLQAHRSDPGLAGSAWRSWKKAEAVYRAILGSARTDGLGSDYQVYIGRGVLQAESALALPVPTDLVQPRPEAEIGFDWVHGLLPVRIPLEAVDEETVRRANELERLHQRMMRVEIAQLLYGSAELEEILGDVDPDALDADPERLERFLRAVAADDRASPYLRGAIEERLGSAP
jgi:hypothetical protein